MKKFPLTTLAAAAVLAVCLAGCSNGAGTESPGAASPSEEIPTVVLQREKASQTDANAPVSADRLVTISTACGEIQGIRQDGYVEYRGVRYAAADRWKEAEPVTKWDGVYDATVWGDRCCQYTGFYGMCLNRTQQFYEDEAVFTWPAGYSEDCLNLNIWTPENAEGCPVLVYIHGGSFLNGSNTDTSTDGAVYAQNGIVMISINYRLGPYATAYGDGYTGNFALLDQIAALRWIRDNIADYGGDPSKITIMGESAGAVSVQALLISPLVEDGLISGAIMMSGGGYIPGNPTTPSVAEPIWETFKEAMSVSSVDGLKALSAKDLYANWLSSVGAYTGVTCLVYNGESLTDNVMDSLRGGTVKNVPCIIGITSDDCSPYGFYSAAAYYGSKRAAAEGEPVYLYYFDRVQPGDTTFGAFHAADLYYAFGTLHRNVRPFTDTDYRIARDMISYFIHFVKSGDPNGSGLAVWEAATTEKQEFLHFGDEVAAMVQPDEALLKRNQQSNPAFPYAAVLKPASDGQQEAGKKAVSPEELLGRWTITGWDITASGKRKDLDYQAAYEFTETQRAYYKDGALANTRDYVWKDEYTIVITIDGEEIVSPIYWGEDGELRLEDPRYGIVYTCYKE